MEKILLVNDSGNFGGVQSVFRNLVKHGAFDEFETDLLFATNGPIYNEIKEMGFNIQYTQELKKLTKFGELKLLFKFLIKVNKVLKNNSYDKVYANGFLSCVSCGILSYKYSNIKFIWHEHNMPRSNLRKKFLSLISKKIKKILVVSKGIARNYLKTIEDKVQVVYNGIESDGIDYINCKDDNIIRFGIVSRIDTGKGHLEVINAFNKLQREDVELYIIGSATTQKAISIEEEIKIHSKLNPKIKVVSFTKDVDLYYKKIDVLIQASTKWDSLPTVLIEAMNYNCALIGTNIGGIPEIVSDKNGFVIELNNLEDELINIMTSISKDNNLMIKQKKSKEILKEKFVIDKQVDEIKKVIKAL